MRLIDMMGQRFGHLVVLRMLPSSRCRCSCDCGVMFETASYSVRKGLTKTCGCSVKAGLHRTHGDTASGHKTPEYRAWSNMITRCCNPKSTRYKDWGGRGIVVCERWQNNYSAFLRDVGRRPSPAYSLDRYPNPDGNYEPGNVRWATAEQQARNQRSNRKITAFGRTMILREWAEYTGIKWSTIHSRIKDGWQIERALSEPTKTQAEVVRIASRARWAKEKKQVA